MTTQEDMTRMAEAMQMLNAQVVDLTRQVQGLQQAQAQQSAAAAAPGPERRPENYLIGKDFKPDKFIGSGYHNWGDDVKAILGTKNVELPRALRWAERRQDDPIDGTDTEEFTDITMNENEALHAYLMLNTAGEPRTIVKGSLGNGLEAWRRLKNRYDPETEMNQIGATIRALKPPKVNQLKDLLPALEKWEDELRRQEDATGAPTLNEPTKKAIITEMAPEELSTHLRLNASKYATYDQMRWQVVNYVNLKLPTQPLDMQIDHVSEKPDYEQWTEDQWDMPIDYITKGKSKGKGFGKNKGYTKGKGKGEYPKGGFPAIAIGVVSTVTVSINVRRRPIT